jgi:hypothetical protein
VTAPIRTLEGTIAWEQARLGQSRHTTGCDWSGGYNVDDCALFQSTAVFGEKAAWNVDVFKTLPGGTYHTGSAGIQRGDVLLYGWTPGHFDHTEMALAAPAGGIVQTIGSNGSDTIAVAYRSRPISYVTGYFRPNYLPATAAQPTEEDDMFTDGDRGTLNAVAEAEGDTRGKIDSVYEWLQDLQPGLAALVASGGTKITAQQIAAAIPADIAKDVADELAKRIANASS